MLLDQLHLLLSLEVTAYRIRFAVTKIIQRPLLVMQP